MAGRRERAKAAKINNIKAVMALKKHSTLAGAYKETHPNCTDESARKNARNMLTPEVVAMFEKAMKLEDFAKTTRPVLEKVLYSVVARWYAGFEQTRDLIATVKILSMLVPEFSDRLSLTDSDSEEDVDRKLKEFGLNPKSFERN